jgi:hypothetical protein
MKDEIMIVIYVNDLILTELNLLIEKRFERTIRDERSRFMHVLFRRDDLQKSTS